MKIILNLKDDDNIILASRAGRYLIENADKKDALLMYGEAPVLASFYVVRNKASISVWEQ